VYKLIKSVRNLSNSINVALLLVSGINSIQSSDQLKL